MIFQTDVISQKFLLWQYYFDFSQMLILTVGHLVFDQNAFGFILGIEYSFICITDAEIWEPHSQMSFLAAFQAESASRRHWQEVRMWKVREAFVRFSDISRTRLLRRAGLMDSWRGSSSGTAVSCCRGHGSGGRGDCRLQQRQREHVCAGRTGKGRPYCSQGGRVEMGLQKKDMAGRGELDS